MAQPRTFTIGLIADTHGLMREEALTLLRGSDHILHAGDIGDPEILERLGSLAPVSAIRGNNDDEKWAEHLGACATMAIGGILIHMLHSFADLSIDPVGLGIRVVIAGHSHRPSIDMRQGVLYVNPGSAGPKRFTLPLSVARLTVTGDQVHAEILPIELPPAAPLPASSSRPRRKRG